jgi:hypothetical protein
MSFLSRIRVVAIVCALALVVPVRAAIPATDDFNRADGAPGSNWTIVSGSLEIVDGPADGNIRWDAAGTISQAVMHWATATDDFNDDQSSQMTCVSGLAASEFCGLIVRASGTQAGGTLDGYYIVCDSGDCYIGEFQDTTPTTLCTLGATIANGNGLKLTAEGAGNVTLKAHKDTGGGYAQLGSTCTDTATYITGGQPGIYNYSTLGEASAVKGNDWTGDNVSGGAPAATRSLGLLGVGQ